MAKELLTILKLDGIRDVKGGLSSVEAGALKAAGAAAALTAAIATAAVKTAEYQDQTIKAARSAGLSSEAYSGLAHAADLSGASQEALRTLTNRLIAPTTQMTDVMERYGISINNTDGSMKSQKDLIYETADAMKKLKNPTDQTALAVKLFGEQGGRLVSMLKDGSEGLENFQKEAEAMGIVVSEKAGIAAEKFNDDAARLKGTLQGLMNTVSESIIEWSNQGNVTERITKAIQSAIMWWRGLDEGLKRAIISVGAAVIGITILIGVIVALKLAFVALIGVISLPVVIFGAMLIAVSALAVGVVKYWDQMGSAAEQFKQMVSDLKATIGKSIDTITSFFNAETQAKNTSKEISILGTVAKIVFTALVRLIDFAVTGFKILKNNVAAAAQTMSDLGYLIYLVHTQQYKAAYDLVIKIKGRVKEALKNTRDEMSGLVDRTRKDLSQNFRVTLNSDDINEATKAVDEFNQQRKVVNEGKLSDFEREVEKLRKAWDAIGQSKGLVELGYNISKFTELVVSKANVIIDAWNKVAQAQAASLKAALDKQMRNLDLMSRIYTKLAQEQIDAFKSSEEERLEALKANQDKELAALKEAEDRKLRLLENYQNERLLMDNKEYQIAKDKAQREHEAYLESERTRFEEKMDQLDEFNLIEEEKSATAAVMEENWKTYREFLELQHEQTMSDLASSYADQRRTKDTENKAALELAQQESNDRISTAEQENNARLESEKERSDAAIQAMQDEKEKNEKLFAKAQAYTQWQGTAAILRSTKAVQTAQTIASGIAGAAQAFAALAPIPFVGPILGAAAAAAIIAATYQSAHQIQTMQVPPPPELLLKTGGAIRDDIAGGTQAGDVIQARLTPGESVLDAQTTRRISAFVAEGLDGRKYSVVIHNYNQGSGELSEKQLNTLGVQLVQQISREMGVR